MPEYGISCRRLTDLATDYLEGALNVRLRPTFEQHAVLCDACAVHLDQLRATRHILGSLAGPAGDDVHELLVEGGIENG